MTHNNAQYDSLTNFLVDSIEQDPTPGNVAAIFQTVRATHGVVNGEVIVGEVATVIAERGTADAMRAVREGEFEREKTIYIRRPDWRTSVNG